MIGMMWSLLQTAGTAYLALTGIPQMYGLDGAPIAKNSCIFHTFKVVNEEGGRTELLMDGRVHVKAKSSEIFRADALAATEAI